MSADQTTADVPPEITEYLDAQQTLTLATASPAGIPRASTFLYVNEGPTLYFWSRANTITARHIDQNPVVSFAIDEYTGDLNNARGAQGIGECSVVLSGDQIAKVADLFGRKYPLLSPGSTMSISFFRITPTEIMLIDNTTAAGQAAREASMVGGGFGAEFHRDRSFSVISDLPMSSADDIIASLPRTEAKAGETIVRQGGPADKFFIVVDGEAEAIRDPDGGGGGITSLGPGSLFGEMAIMRDQPRSSTVVAKTDVKLLALTRDTFRELISQSLGITAEFDQVIRARLDALGRD